MVTEGFIAELQAQVYAEGRWLVRTDDLASRFDPVDFYRAVYQTSQTGVDAYGPSNTADLIELLNVVTGLDWLTAFHDAGLFLTHEDRIDLTGRLVRALRLAAVIHVPDLHAFRAMLRDLRRYETAARFYLETFVPQPTIVDRCARDYVAVRGLSTDDPVGASLLTTVIAYFELLIERHVVELHRLAGELIDVLIAIARAEGVLPDRGRAADANDRAANGNDAHAARRPTVSERRSAALELLGVRSPRPTSTEIRDAYRRLMRRYHPDINPSGLEMAKRINNAYGELMEIDVE